MLTGLTPQGQTPLQPQGGALSMSQSPTALGGQPLPTLQRTPGFAAGGMVKYAARGGPHFGHLMRAAGVRVPGIGHMKMSIPLAEGGSVDGCKLYAIRQKHAYKEGGLVKAASEAKDAGRWNDTILVHLNPSEAQELSAKHGPPTINPKTGLPEFGFFSFIGSLLKTIAPIAALAIPGVGEFLAPALEGIGVGAGFAPILGSALAGAALGGITGGGRGALIGGVTGGLGSGLGGDLTNSLTSSLGANGARAVTNALMGAGMSGAAGGNPLTGALVAGGASLLFPQTTASIANMFGPSASAAGTGAATGGLGSAAGSVTTGGTAGIPSVTATGLSGDALSTPLGGTALGTAAPSAGAAGMGATGAAASSAGLSNKLLPALTLLAAIGQGNQSKVYTSPPPAFNGPSYFKQPFTPTPYAPQINQSALDMIRNNPGVYASQGGPGFYEPGTTGFGFTPGQPQNYAKGGKTGALFHVKQDYREPSPAAERGMVKGPGSGTEDLIPAQLSDGEHIFDSELVSQIGDGSNDEGHRRLEEMKRKIRRKKHSGSDKKIPPKLGALERYMPRKKVA